MHSPKLTIHVDLSKSNALDYIIEYIASIDISNEYNDMLVTSVENIYTKKYEKLYTYENLHIMGRYNKCYLHIINTYEYCSKMNLIYTDFGFNKLEPTKSVIQKYIY